MVERWIETQSYENEQAHLNKYPKLDHKSRPSGIVRDLMADHLAAGAEDAFYIADMGAVIRQHRQWQDLLPRVQPFYAVKCNNNPQVLRTLLSLGTGFDCASRGEMETMLTLGADPLRMIYANPCKQASHIRFARDHGVRRMTFDNASELYKIREHYPEAEMVLRVLTDDSRSICKLGTKFGCRPENTLALLQTAKSLGISVVGVSFHVGSGCRDRMAFVDAVQRARRVFDEGKSLGFHFTLLDVGGGFPGAKCSSQPQDGEATVQFDEIAEVLGPAIDMHFPVHEMPEVQVIAEPGRYYVAAAFTLAVSVTSRRVISAGGDDNDSDRTFMYYVNDGVYGSFNCLLFDHAQVTPQVLSRHGQVLRGDVLVVDASEEKMEEEPLFACSVWGPTCDSMDCLTKTARLPEMAIGDWLAFEDMGAYTVAAASRFNGFELSHITYINTEEGEAMVDMGCSSPLSLSSVASSMSVSSGCCSEDEVSSISSIDFTHADDAHHHQQQHVDADAASSRLTLPVAVC